MRLLILSLILAFSYANGMLCPILLKHKHAECRDSCEGFGDEDTFLGKLGCVSQKCCIPNPDNIPTTSEPEPTTEMKTSTMTPMATGTTVDPSEQCGMRPVKTTRILHGSRSKPCDWPWQISIRSRHSEGPLTPATTFSLCSGVLIDKQWVLTTAYCIALSASQFSGDVSNNMLIVAGEYDHTGGDYRGSGYIEQFIQVAEVMVHPKYYKPDYRDFTVEDVTATDDDKTSNNLALIKLATPVEFGDCVRKVCTPMSDNCWSKKKTCKIAGWGNTAAGKVGETSDVPMIADVTLYSPEVCEAVFELQMNVSEPMKSLTTCAKPNNMNVNVCFGDNGGMVVCENEEGRWDVEGLISRPSSATCNATDSNLLIVSYVTPAMEWVKQVTGM